MKKSKRNSSFKSIQIFSIDCILLLGFLSFSYPILSQPTVIQSYEYRKKILPTNPLNQGGGMGSFLIDQEVYQRSYYKDLRIVDSEGKILPYKRQNKSQETGKKGVVKPKPLFSKPENDGILYVLEIPPIPSQSQMEALKIQSSNPFEARVEVQMGNQPNNPEEIRKEFVFSYNTNRKPPSIPLNTKYYRYVRVYFDSTIDVSFLELQYGNKMEDTQWEFPVEIPNRETSMDGRIHVYQFSNENRIPFRSLQLEWDSPAFRRKYSLYKKDHVFGYQLIAEGIIESNPLNPSSKNPSLSEQKYGQVEIDLVEPIHSDWKLEVEVGDNPPMELKQVVLKHPQEELLFFVPQDISSNELYLYYGFSYAKEPNFDTLPFEQSHSIQRIEFQLGPEEINPHQSWHLLYPPFSLWLIRIVFALGLGWSFYFAYKALQNIQGKT